MRILVVLVSSNKLVCQKFGERHEKILRANCLPGDLGEHATFDAKVFNPQIQGPALDDFFIKNLGEADAVAVLLDRRYENMASSFRTAFFFGAVDLSEYIENIQNTLSGVASKLLRNLGHLLVVLQDSTGFQAAALPLSNFQANELVELVDSCRTLALEGNFQREMKACVELLKRRRGPKRRSDYPGLYFKDDQEVHFQYGYEEHARYETGGTHLIACDLNGLFRFGRRLEVQRHYNVSRGPGDDDRITATFHNCHGVAVNIANRTHVNMFSNDFHK